MLSATVEATEERPVRRTKALRIGFKMTKPESQKTGMETIQPMMSMAISGCFFPTALTTTSAILSAAPVFSSKVPTKAPRMITMPIDLKVAEKPSPMILGISAKLSPPTSAKMSAISMMAIKA